MSYVLYHRETTKLVKNAKRGNYFNTLAAARAARTRLKLDTNDYAVEVAEKFHNSIEKQETKRNLQTGQEFSQPVNTPASCDPSTETYWSM